MVKYDIRISDNASGMMTADCISGITKVKCPHLIHQKVPINMGVPSSLIDSIARRFSSASVAYIVYIVDEFLCLDGLKMGQAVESLSFTCSTERSLQMHQVHSILHLMPCMLPKQTILV